MTITYRSMLVLAVVSLSTGAGAAAQERMEARIWDGPMNEFSKADGADPELAANQDRITDSVWITRGNGGGQIFNIRAEERASKGSSPAGTRWAVGTLDKLDSLSFTDFRSAVGRPRSVEGMDLVMHIVEEDIYLQLSFTQWSEGRAGGFAYQRSTR